MIFMDNFLRKLSSEELTKLNAIRLYWEIPESTFVNKLDAWFANFDSEQDKRLAMKIVENIQYFSPDAFNKQLKNLFQPISRYLQEFNKNISDVVIVLPAERADSADKHAYDITKLWNLPQGCAVSLDKFDSDKINGNSVLIAFNDTHGTGNQFIYDIWSELKKLEVRLGEVPVLFIVAITIAEKAKDYFKFSFSDYRVTVIPEVPANSAKDIFTATEYDRLEELCSRVYPSHKMGYGNTGLLTAYYFQCPNNTLPIIWADGNNNKVSGVGYPWNPLFSYNPKSNAKKTKGKEAKPGAQKFKNKSNLKLKTADEKRINNILSEWGFEYGQSESQIGHLNKWLNNFTADQIDIAMAVLSKIRYLNVTHVRVLIKKLGKQVLSDVRSKGGDKSDILLVLTGYDKPSVYHHVFDFLKFWDLKLSQAITLEDLDKSKYLALNKSLVYFYHTRMNDNSHFTGEIWPKVSGLPAKAHYVLSFAMSEEADCQLGQVDGPKIKRFYDKEISRTAGEVFSQEMLNRIKKIYKSKTGKHIEEIEKKMLVTYYFGCPQATLPIVRKGEERWMSLFG